jgi:hypothetical protein
LFSDVIWQKALWLGWILLTWTLQLERRSKEMEEVVRPEHGTVRATALPRRA